MTAFVWEGRDDGPGPEHRRFWRTVRSAAEGRGSADAALVGFASDEGVRRNRGRVGAADGPEALRRALAPLAVHDELVVVDHGDVTVDGGDLESAQSRLGEVVAGARRQAPLTVVLGGGHETSYGSSLGLEQRAGLGVINVDAHLDLRDADEATSGTPFAQIARDREQAGLGMSYAVVGVSRTSNTTALLDAAERLGASWLVDDDSQDVATVTGFVREVLDPLEQVHLTIDLDVLPSEVAPGVSAPAALGVPLAVVQAVCDVVVDSGKLVHLDVAELCPRFDVDGRTARAAARLVHRVVTRETARRRQA